MSNLFEIQNFHVKDQDTELLKNFSLELQKGEVITIVGQEGSGKNAIINGLIGKLPAEGKLFHMGQIVPFNLYDLKKNKIEIINQKPRLLENLSVSENLFLDTSYKKKLSIFYFKRKTRKVVEEILKKYNLNLSPYMKVGDLTLEEKKNLAFVRAFSVNPDVVILYEPAENISLSSLMNLHNMVRTHKKEGKSVIYITKQWEDALRIADKIAILNEGEITEILDSQEVKNNPKKLINKIMGINSDDNNVNSEERQLIESVFEAAEYLTSEYELDDLMNLLAKNAAKAMKADACGISLMDDDTNTIIDKAFYKRNKNVEVEPNESEILNLIGDEKVYYFSKRDKGFEKFFKINKDICSFICVPLYIRSRLSGIIHIYYKEVYIYSEEEIKYLETIAHQAALAIHDTRLVGSSVLLQESHHRIKNNLQSIISLMSLYKMSNKKDSRKDVVEMLDDLMLKIKSIAAVHDLLSKDKLGRSIINLKEMIIKIVKFMSSTREEIRFNFELDDIFVSYSKASAIALVVNELVTNSLKYAFVGKENGEITIISKFENETIKLEISDNGVGFPQNFDIQNTQGLGLSIVYSIITKQLNGEIYVESANGAKVRIEIPVKQIGTNSSVEEIEKI
ncbi:ATP-binding cassette domain-containing protein [Petrotoga sp. DB-2]